MSIRNTARHQSENDSPQRASRLVFCFPAMRSGMLVIFAHGNLTSATFWEETMLAMPAGYHCIALDQRGFGESDPDVAIDGARGLADMSDDVVALMDTLGIEKAHASRSFHGRGCYLASDDGCARAPLERNPGRAGIAFRFRRDEGR